MILDYLLYGTYSANDLIIVAIVMIFAFVFHNYFQAWMASRYGDSSPRFSGFLSFDLQQHLEPMGVLFLFLLGFGWPKPIPTNSRNYKGRGQQEAIVWYSGPVAYLIVAFVATLLAVIVNGFNSPVLARSFILASSTAIIHAVINLFPVYPLDGARAALAWGNADVRRTIQQIASYGFIGFIAVFLLLSLTGILGGLERLFQAGILRLVSLIPGL